MMTYRATIMLLASGIGLAGVACGGSGDTGTTGATGGSSGTATTASGMGGTSAGGAGGGSSSGGAGGAGMGGASAAPPTVFMILMENHNWVDIKGSASAPYINNTLLMQGSHAEQYYNPPGLHPSEPNYIWLEAGDNLGVTDDSGPSANHQATTDHLVTLIEKAGLTWKSYQEDISGTDCPLKSVKDYAPKHNPMVFFDDVTGTNDAQSANCIAHVRPYTELAADLAMNKVASYNFLTPNLCNDMHDSCPPQDDQIKQGDDWLAAEVPKILASEAYKANGYLFITWDEAEGGGDGPIGMIVLSPHAKGKGYTGMVKYTHSSTLRTVQEILGVMPLLRDAANATDLGDLFEKLP